MKAKHTLIHQTGKLSKMEGLSIQLIEICQNFIGVLKKSFILFAKYISKFVFKRKKLPFYKITIGLKSIEQKEPRQTISVIREFRETDLDRIWHMLNVKCEEKWGRKLKNFDCVRISKRSPDFKKYIRDRQQKAFNQYDDILSPACTLVPSNKSSNSVNSPQSVYGQYRNQK